MADLTQTSSTSNGLETLAHLDDTSETLGDATTTSLPSSPHSDPPIQRYTNPWRPKVFRIRPWVGLASLAISVGCLFVSLGILMGSRGQPIESWTFQPTVYLAIATAISNTAINAALAQAAPISWWWKVSRGSTISDLELEWEAGQSFPRAIVRCLRQGRHFNLLTMASLVVALVVIDGPLLQRSSSVRSATIHKVILQDIALAPELPHGFSGHWWPNDVVGSSKMALKIATAFSSDAPTRSSARCDGSCRMTVRAPGVLRNNCTTKEWPLTEPMFKDPSSSWGSQYLGQTSSKPFIFVHFWSFSSGSHMGGDFSYAGLEDAMLMVGRVDTRNFTGSYIETNCSLRAAVVEYDVRLEGHDISFATPPSSGQVIALADNTYLNTTSNTTEPLTWLGFLPYLSIYSSANGTFNTDLSKGHSTYPVPSSLNAMIMRHVVDLNDVAIVVSDPTEEVMNNINNMMFRGGIIAADSGQNLTRLMDAGLSANQSVPANQTLNLNVFESDLRWFAGAVTIQMIALALILPVFWGWWNIGLVDMTVSPFHLAKLFDAPLLRGVNSAAGARDINQDVGDLRVKLGLIESDVLYQSAKDGEMESSGQWVRLSRLGIAEAPRVVAPQKGMRFTQ